MTDIQITHIYKTNVWIENDIFGGIHVMVQHETCEPFKMPTKNELQEEMESLKSLIDEFDNE